MLVKCKKYQRVCASSKYCVGSCDCDCDKKGNIRVRVERQEIINELKKQSPCQICRAQKMNPNLCYTCMWIHINSIEPGKSNFIGG